MLCENSENELKDESRLLRKHRMSSLDNDEDVSNAKQSQPQLITQQRLPRQSSSPYSVLKEEENNNLTLEQFTDIVLASEGFKAKFIKIHEDKVLRVKPVVLAPRSHPVNHNLEHYSKIPLANKCSSSVVVSVKPRVQDPLPKALNLSMKPIVLCPINHQITISTIPFVKPPLSPPRLEIKKITKHSFSKQQKVVETSVKVNAKQEIETALLKDEYGNYPIHRSVLLRKPSLVRKNCCALQLLETTVDQLNEENYTPLHLSILDNNVEISEILLTFGANPLRRDHRGNSCFHLAAAIKGHDCLKLLVHHESQEQEVDLDSFNDAGIVFFSFISSYSSGITPLQIALKKNDTTSISILLEGGATMNILNTMEGNILEKTIKEENQEK